MEVFWGSIPSDQWNGEPISIIVKYWVSKQGANYVAGRTVNNIVLDYDRRFYRILDLEFNTEVSVVIMGATIVGSGKESSVISGSKYCDLSNFTRLLARGCYLSHRVLSEIMIMFSKKSRPSTQVFC